MDGLKRQFTDLVAREGTFHFFLAHIDSAVVLVAVVVGCNVSLGCNDVFGGVVRSFGAQPITRHPRLSGGVLEDIREDAVCRVRRTRLLTRSLVGQRVPSRDSVRETPAESRVLPSTSWIACARAVSTSAETHHLQELGAFLLGDIRPRPSAASRCG